MIINYTPAEYTQFVNNIPHLNNDAKRYVKEALANGWACTQADNGKLYFATTAGVLEFDGQRWDAFFLIKNSTDDFIAARSIRFDKNTQKVYVGGENDFGYLEKQPNGKLIYVSLSNKIKARLEKATGRPLAEIWSIQIYNREIYFHSRFGVFIYDGKEVRVIPTKESYHRLFLANKKLYLRQDSLGLCRLENDKFVPVNFGEAFAPASFQISGLIPYYKGGLLVGTRREGLFIYGEYGETKQTTLSKKEISPTLDAQLKESQIYHILQLANGNIAISTLRNGLFILDRDLHLLHHLNEANGLQTNSVLYTFQDKEGYIWITSFNGISKIELNTPLSRWNEKQNITMGLNSLVKYKADVYATCNVGLLKLDKKTNAFQLVPGILTQAFALNEVQIAGKERLFIGADNLYELIDGVAVPLLKLQGRTIITNIVHLPTQPDVLYCLSNSEKMLKVTYLQGKVEKMEVISITNPGNQNLAFIDKEGGFWLSNLKDPEGNIFKIYNPKEDKITLKYPKTAFKNLPVLKATERFEVNVTADFAGNIMANLGGEIYILDPQTKAFAHQPAYRQAHHVPDSANFYFIGNHEKRFALYATTKDRDWDLFITPTGAGTYKTDSVSNRFFFENGCQFRFYDADKKEVWYAGQKVLYKHDLNVKQKYNTYFPAYIRTVQPLHNPDSLVVHDIFGDNPKAHWQLAYTQNSLRFEFSAVDFSNKEKVKFRYFLENNDLKWSDWTLEAYKEYTNLPEGIYTLHLQAQNHYGFYSQTASFTFVILAPWYRTWWAYLVYVLVGGLLVYLLIYLNLRRLRQQNEYLAHEVRKRTLEIEEQRDEILAQSEELRQSNEEVYAQKEEIESQRDVVEKQNNELVDSIAYGSRIQAAMLPFKERISLTLPAYFIFFKPRDVVSGDFYWFHDTNPQEKQAGKSVIAVADCTGHGVPGAFMSMIANQIIYEVVIKKQVLEVDIILNQLHLEVRRTLRQYETDNRDGMDIGLVVWDKDKHLLEFAGAKNNMLYFREGDSIIIKGDKQPIGGEQREIVRTFTKNTIELSAPITFYLYSDGFQDQFGGSENKKFSPKRLRDLLTDIHTKEMPKQAEILENTFMKWQEEGRERQTDDVLIWGVKM